MHIGSIRLNSSEANDDDSNVDNVGKQKNEYLLEAVPTEQKFQCVTVILDTRLYCLNDGGSPWCGQQYHRDT